MKHRYDHTAFGAPEARFAEVATGRIQFGQQVGHYVYALVDPRSGLPFYFGKGSRSRASQHLRQPSANRANPAKRERICEIREAGLEPEIAIIADRLPKGTAFEIEASLISEFRRILTNTFGPDPDIDRKWAQACLAAVIPFDEWLARRPRSQDDIDTYHRLVREVRRIGEEGCVTSVQTVQTWSRDPHTGRDLRPPVHLSFLR